jgi:hypothetical protein
MMGAQGATASRVAEVFLCCLQCMLCCLENFLKYMNKNAYFQCAIIFGSNLCCSAREAFFLILHNAARVGALTIICGVVAFTGKVFIALERNMLIVGIIRVVGTKDTVAADNIQWDIILCLYRTIFSFLYGKYTFQIREHYTLRSNTRFDFPCLEKPCLFLEKTV